MEFPPVAHYGTTLEAEPAPEGNDVWSVPLPPMMARTDRFLTLFGLAPFAHNDFGPLGRQILYRRGTVGEPGYFEKDSFGSYAARRPPAVTRPRVADVVFRLTHEDPDGVFEAWLAEDLVELLAREPDRRLLRGPDTQSYELVGAQTDPLEHHVIYVWTDPAELDTIAAELGDQFDIRATGEVRPFYDLGQATLFSRPKPPVTLALLTPPPGQSLEPRWSDDIFSQVGYSHFRLSAPDRTRVKAANREAFPDTGPVSYVHFQHTYLELVEAPG